MKSLKIFLSIIICAPIFLSCTDKINTQIREKVESSDHDARLYGWWQRINNESRSLVSGENFSDKVLTV